MTHQGPANCYTLTIDERGNTKLTPGIQRTFSVGGGEARFWLGQPFESGLLPARTSLGQPSDIVLADPALLGDELPGDEPHRRTATVFRCDIVNQDGRPRMVAASDGDVPHAVVLVRSAHKLQYSGGQGCQVAEGYEAMCCDLGPAMAHALAVTSQRYERLIVLGPEERYNLSREPEDALRMLGAAVSPATSIQYCVHNDRTQNAVWSVHERQSIDPQPRFSWVHLVAELGMLLVLSMLLSLTLMYAGISEPKDLAPIASAVVIGLWSVIHLARVLIKEHLA